MSADVGLLPDVAGILGTIVYHRGHGYCLSVEQIPRSGDSGEQCTSRHYGLALLQRQAFYHSLCRQRTDVHVNISCSPLSALRGSCIKSLVCVVGHTFPRQLANECNVCSTYFEARQTHLNSVVLLTYPQMYHVRGMMTLSKRMLPIRLGYIKRSLYHLASASSSSSPAVSTAASPIPPAASTITVEAPQTSKPLEFVDVQDVIADVESQTAAAPSVPLGIPNLPRLPKIKGFIDDITLDKKRARKALKPGQWDPELRNKMSKREKELLERKSYLRNFWYAAGKSIKCMLHHIIRYAYNKHASLVEATEVYATWHPLTCSSVLLATILPCM